MKPILFNTDMVRAILDDRKTVTRRAAFPEKDMRPFPRKDYPDGWWFRGRAYASWDDAMRQPQGVMSLCRYRPGDILYVRETWQYAYDYDENERAIEGTGRYLYAADENNPSFDYWIMPDGTHRDSMPWRPSIHMPREAARIFLRVADVRVERLQDIADDDCAAEGICAWTKDGKLYKYYLADEEGDYPACKWSECPRTPQAAMKRIWDSTIKKADRALYGWDANPWVWVIELERISKEEAFANE